jgi:hypothetical protein
MTVVRNLAAVSGREAGSRRHRTTLAAVLKAFSATILCLAGLLRLFTSDLLQPHSIVAKRLFQSPKVDIYYPTDPYRFLDYHLGQIYGDPWVASLPPNRWSLREATTNTPSFQQTNQYLALSVFPSP